MSLRLSIVCLLIIALTLAIPAAGSTGSGQTIVVLGDSLTAGYGLARQDAFPTQLEAALRKNDRNVKVINSGVSGDTSAGGLNRIDWALADHPDLLILTLGSNDAMRGFDPETTRNNLAAIIEKVLEKNIKVLLAGMKAPRNLGSPYYTKFDSIYDALAAEYNIPLYPFFLEGVATDPALNQQDGIHPNREGVQVMVKNILPYVQKLLGEE